MDSAIKIFQKLSPLISYKSGIVIFIFTIVFLLTGHAIKVNSESETKSYRQESVFNQSADINPHPIIKNYEETKPITIAMSYEEDKITPTPTPAFSPSDDAVWLKVAECESHQNWKDDTGNGYYGGLQFSLGAWASVGGSGKPSDASADEQISRGKLLQHVRGWGAWGGCSKRLGLN